MEQFTTCGIQNISKKIAKEFIIFVNTNKSFNDNNLELMLLLNKINSNIQAALLLTSRKLFGESKIIFRSAFESLVLFMYLLEYPKEMTHYHDDNYMTEVKNVYMCYKRDFVNIQNVIDCYKKFESKISRKDSPFEKIGIDNPKFENELDKYFRGDDRNCFKPLSQQIMYMIKKLNDTMIFEICNLSRLQVTIYNLNSEVAHSRLSTLHLPLGNLTKEETISEIKKSFFQAVNLWDCLIKILEVKYKYKHPEKLSSLLQNLAYYSI